MGEVLAAYDPHLDRKVALKVLHAAVHAAVDAGTARPEGRLLREAKAMARLSHANVVAVHDTGTFEGRVYIAMEYVDGATLEEWLAEAPRARDAVVASFVAAGRGLAAAHAAGIVHRDFNPRNVMVARDGSVRVTDFGLARAVAAPTDDDAELPPGASSPEPQLTHTGDLVGTPLFMAPEQFAGGAIDARTDQFSFCVALYRALYGVAPFRDETLPILRSGVLAGRVEPPPSKSAVPSWLRRVLLRGLSVDPADRWPSMKELIAAVERDPARTRRRWGVAAGAASLAAIAVMTIARGEIKQAPLCVGGPSRLAGVWDAAGDPRSRRAAVETAFLGSGAPGARDVLERVAAVLDRYRDGWLSMYRQACEATHVRHEQAAALLDLRMACLDDRRRALAALTTVLATADSGVVTRGVDAASALPSLATCGDQEQLEAAVEPPPDEATRRRVLDLRARAATTKALNDTGKHEEALRLAREQLGEARSLGYPPLLAEQLVAVSRSWAMGTNFHADGVPITEEALWTSLAAGRDDLAAEAAVMLINDVGYHFGRHEEGRAWAQLAQALVERSGAGHEELEAELLENDALVADTSQGPDVRLTLMDRALMLKQKVLPPEHPSIAAAFNNEAEQLAAIGRFDEALGFNARALQGFSGAYGPASSEVAMTLSNRAEYLLGTADPARALEQARQALPLWEAQVGRDHQFLGYPLTAEGRALLALARPNEAIPPLERALGLREATEGDPRVVAETRFALARARWDANADRVRARALATSARDVYTRIGDVKHAGEVAAWLATR
jgi:hypothetical protein